jgi:hypothetical protein
MAKRLHPTIKSLKKEWEAIIDKAIEGSQWTRMDITTGLSTILTAPEMMHQDMNKLCAEIVHFQNSRNALNCIYQAGAAKMVKKMERRAAKEAAERAKEVPQYIKAVKGAPDGAEEAVGQVVDEEAVGQ